MKKKRRAEITDENIVSANPLRKEDTEQKEKAKRRKMIFRLIYAAVIVAILIGAVIYVFFNYHMAVKTAEAGNFNAASAHFNRTVFIGEDRDQLEAFISAGLLMEDKQFEEAAVAFADMRGYLNADEMVHEAFYRKAAYLADNNNFSVALEIYGSLSKLDYKDTAQLYSDTYYRQAEYELKELKDYQSAYRIAQSLISSGYEKAEELREKILYDWACDYADKKQYASAYEKFSQIPDYKGVRKAMEDMLPALYTQAQADYRLDNYKKAWDAFSLIDPYLRSDDYLTLLYEKYGLTQTGCTPPFSGSAVDAVAALFDFEDAAEVLLSAPLADAFLTGTWSGEGYYFTMNADGSTSSNLPGANNGGYHTIENGIFSVYAVPDDSLNAEKVFSFKLLTQNSMNVYCYSNGQTYRLYR